MKRVRWRKRLLAAMCAMMCLLGLSVQAFASIRNVSYADAAAELKRYFPLLEGTTDTCVLNVSFENSSVANLEEAKEAWKMVMGEWLNDPEYTVLFAMQTSPVTVYACKTSNFSGWSGSGSSRSANFSGDFYEFSFYTSRDTGGIFPLNRFVHSSNGGQVSSFVSPNTVWYKSAVALASRSDCPGAVGIYQDRRAAPASRAIRSPRCHQSRTSHGHQRGRRTSGRSTRSICHTTARYLNLSCGTSAM